MCDSHRAKASKPSVCCAPPPAVDRARATSLQRFGLPPVNPEQERGGKPEEHLVFMLDAHRLSKYAPSGMSIRHYGLQVAVDPDRPEHVFSVIVGKTQSSQHTWIEIKPNGIR